MAIDSENFNGLAHNGIPVIIRSSTNSPTAATAASAAIATARTNSGRCARTPDACGRTVRVGAGQWS